MANAKPLRQASLNYERPKHQTNFLGRFATPKTFLLAFCMQNILQGASTTYFVGVATSLEKHFHFTSKDIGNLVMLCEIGPISTSLVLSHLGNRGNRPRWLAFGMMTSALGLLCAFLTSTFYDPPSISESGSLNDSRKYCDVIHANSTHFHEPNCFKSNMVVFLVWLLAYTLLGIGSTMVYSIGAPYLDDNIKKNDSPVYFAIILAVKIMGPFVGFGLAAVFLKIYYVPDNNPGLTSMDPRWIGAWWGGTLLLCVLNVIFGLIINLFPQHMQPIEDDQFPTSATTESSGEDRVPEMPSLSKKRKYSPPKKIDIKKSREEQTITYNEKQNDYGSTKLKNAKPFFTKWRSDTLSSDELQKNSVDSKKIKDEQMYNEKSNDFASTRLKNVKPFFTKRRSDALNETPEDLQEEPETIGDSLAEFRAMINRLLGNKAMGLTVFVDFFAFLGILGFFLWLPKYLEHQFRVDKAESALYAGIAGTSSVILGVLGGGFFIRQCRPSATVLVRICALCKAIYIISLIGMMFISCDFNRDLPGKYNLNTMTLNLQHSCSRQCSCSLREFIPVCLRENGVNKQTFFSPCHAGCPPQESENKPGMPHLITLQEYKNCTCSPGGTALTSGYCEKTCFSFTLYNIVNVVIKSFISVGAIGTLLISMRCVEPKDKAAALGLKGTVVALGLLITPLVYGVLADSSCIVWEAACDSKGSCWVYDSKQLGYKIHIASAVLFFASFIFELVLSCNVSHIELLDPPEQDGQIMIGSQKIIPFKGSLRRSIFNPLAVDPPIKKITMKN